LICSVAGKTSYLNVEEIYSILLPAWVLCQVGVLHQLGLWDGEEIHLVVPLAADGLAFVGDGTIVGFGELHLDNVLKELISLFPTAYIPETMTLES
jgi:hypothetical protein